MISSPTDRLPLFPLTTSIEDDGLSIAGCALAALAEAYGTPLYLYDRATLDASVTAYQAALRAYPGLASVTYAGKAYLSKALAQWTQQHSCWVDCTGEGEMTIARAGGVPRERILVHGVNKSPADLTFALQHAGTLVVDNLAELTRLAALFATRPALFPVLWLRLLPGIAVETHHVHTQTGQHESKFGLTGEELREAARFCRAHGLPLKGLHFHQGSNFRDLEPLMQAIEGGLALAQEIGLEEDWHFSPGGGWGVAYHEEELPHPDVAVYVRAITDRVQAGCAARGLPLPHLHLEPGRSLVARAGVALYRVGGVKTRGAKTWLLTDGGMADNPRYALYGARYTCLPVANPTRAFHARAAIAGPYCESGDILIEDLPMPEIETGEVLAIPAAGAYQLSMSSHYNGARKPAVVWLEHGRAHLIQRRETGVDLLRRDEALPTARPEEPGERTWALLNRPVEDLRREASIHAERVSQARLGEAVRVLEQEDAWCQIRLQHDGYVGWVHREALFFCEETDVATYAARCNAIVSVPLAEAWDERQTLIQKIPFATLVGVEQREAEWAGLRLPDARLWWVRAADLTPLAERPRPDAAGIAQTLELLRNFVGVTYLWGGRTPYGFDCSGLAQTFYAFMGVAIPRDAHPQFEAGLKVATPPEAGDLLFFGEPGADGDLRISHVAISLGGDEFIHANGRAWGVSINRFAPLHGRAPEWLDVNYRGARRFR